MLFWNGFTFISVTFHICPIKKHLLNYFFTLILSGLLLTVSAFLIRDLQPEASTHWISQLIFWLAALTVLTLSFIFIASAVITMFRKE